jgi:oligopeptide transport system permease protein
VRWYIARRVLQMIPVVIGATLLIKLMVYVQPGDPIAAMFGERPPNPAVVAELRSRYGLDKGFFTQWWKFISGFVQGDFGLTLTGREVRDVVQEAFPVTFRLATMAFVFEAVLGIGFGTIAGLRKGKLFDSTMLVLSLLVIAVPIFVFGFLMQFVFGVKLGWVSPTVGSDASFQRLILPAVVLGSVSFAYILRLTRTSVAENKTADHVRTATAKGLSERDVVTRHIMRNSLIPVVTFLGADFGALLAGALVTEGIFNVPGIGYALYDAVRRNDGSTTVAIVTLMVLIYVVVNLLVDLLYAVLDPRIRYDS